VACTFDFAEKKVRLIWHRIFKPSPQEPLDFESTVERTLLELKRRFAIREIRFDPFQMQATAQQLAAAGLPMVEVAQVASNLTESSTNLYELLKGRNIIVYPDEEIRLAVGHSVALESTRGWRIAKEKASHKIDVVVALAMSALAAVQQGQQPPQLECLMVPVRRWSARWQETSVSNRLYARGEDVAAEEDLEDELKRIRRRHDRWHGF
jgi:hypothetical protein